MSDFSPITVVAAAEVIECSHSHQGMETLDIEWGLDGRTTHASKSGRVALMSRIATSEDRDVYTEHGKVPLARAMVEKALTAPTNCTATEGWRKLVAGLRFDGFEIVEQSHQSDYTAEARYKLRRMLPADIPELDFREAESEIDTLLNQNGFSTASGHLKQATSAFARGEWASANAQMRSFFEGLLNEIAERLGCDVAKKSKEKRDFLGKIDPPFLLAQYNEWNANHQKPQYVQGLMNRMHPHGGHPGLSEEEDATFRLQITLISARLFLRRYNLRKKI